MYGLDAAWLPNHVTISSVDPTGTLLTAASPVMDRLATILDGTDCSVILADRNVTLVDIRHGSFDIGAALTENDAVPGRIFTEATSGTNAISTVHELREPLAVRGDEHFFEAMKMFSCYGFPIIHPTTGRIEGVIALTFFVAEDHPLLLGLVAQGADEISKHLGDVHRSDWDLLNSFRSAVRAGGNAPVIAIAPDMIIANTVAAERLDAVDYMSLSARGAGATGHHVLGSGQQVDVRLQKARSATMIQLVVAVPDESDRPSGGGAPSSSREDRIATLLADSRRARSSVAVVGEPGTGRSAVLANLMADRNPADFDALDVAYQPEKAWLQGVLDALEIADRPVLVENVHLLSPLIAHGLYVAADQSSAWFAVSSAPLTTLSPDVFRLVDSCRRRIELLPLRLRKHEIPALIEDILGDSKAPVRFTPPAMRALIAYDWPGNLTELRAEVLAASRTRSVGDVTTGDLGRLQERMAARPLGAIDGVVRTVIEDELARHKGNKVAVARSLNISRTTLYKRMRAFGISG